MSGKCRWNKSQRYGNSRKDKRKMSCKLCLDNNVYNVIWKNLGEIAKITFIFLGKLKG